jgi:hypothetical protein
VSPKRTQLPFNKYAILEAKLNKNTVYVIGAGASFEVGLPVGSELKSEIAKTLRMKFEYNSFKDGNYDLYQAFRRHTKNNNAEVNEYLTAAARIRKNMPLATSIDNFIDSERGNGKLALCGKIGIVDSILKAERKSRLYFSSQSEEQSIIFSSLEKTWYLPFFRTLTENCRSEDLLERFSAVTLIIFNYDRCIEHFLFHALKNYYNLKDADVISIISNLTIIHPYGTVGALQWQEKLSSTIIEFGSEIHTRDIIEYANRIRTFTEGAHSEIMSTLQKKMRSANRLIYLGFAFHYLNMKLLSAADLERYDNTSTIECYATAYETSKSDQDSIRGSIHHLYKGELQVNIENMTCCQLFEDYSRSLGYT